MVVFVVGLALFLLVATCEVDYEVTYLEMVQLFGVVPLKSGALVCAEAAHPSVARHPRWFRLCPALPQGWRQLIQVIFNLRLLLDLVPLLVKFPLLSRMTLLLVIC